jgi:hypothetical protein
MQDDSIGEMVSGAAQAATHQICINRPAGKACAGSTFRRDSTGARYIGTDENCCRKCFYGYQGQNIVRDITKWHNAEYNYSLAIKGSLAPAEELCVKNHKKCLSPCYL